MATAASPAPRKMALMRKSKVMLRVLPIITCMYRTPLCSTHGLPPMRARRRGAKVMPSATIGAASRTAKTMACTAVSAARSVSFSPVRRAMRAMAPMLTPMATAYTR